MRISYRDKSDRFASDCCDQHLTKYEQCSFEIQSSRCKIHQIRSIVVDRMLSDVPKERQRPSILAGSYGSKRDLIKIQLRRLTIAHHSSILIFIDVTTLTDAAS